MQEEDFQYLIERQTIALEQIAKFFSGPQLWYIAIYLGVMIICT